MNLQPVTGKFCFVFCCKCGEQTAIGDGADQFRRSPGKADLDGEPFKAYYCSACYAWHGTATTPWERCMNFEHGRFNETHTLWSRLMNGEHIFTALRKGTTPAPDDGGYRSIDAALRQKGML